MGYTCDDCGKEGLRYSEVPKDAIKLCFDCCKKLIKNLTYYEEKELQNNIDEFNTNTIYMIGTN